MNGEKNYLVHFGVKGMKWKNHTYKSIIGGEYVYDQVSNMAADLKKQGLSHEEIKTQIRSTMGQQRSQAANNSSAGNYSQAAQRAEQRIQQEKTQQSAKASGYASEVANARAKAAQDAVAKEKELAVKAEERTARLAKEKEEKKAQEEARKKAAEEAAAKEEAEKAAKKAKKGSGKKGSSKKGSSSKKKTEEKKTETTDEELEDLANKVISGVYGNGAQRKAALGDRYQEVQRLVNEKLKGGKSSTSQVGTSKQETTQEVSGQKTSKNDVGGKSGTKTKAKMETYTKGDPDFDSEEAEKNAKRIGGTDFFSYKRSDGKYVVIEEDAKWVLDSKPDTSRINDFDNYLDALHKTNTKYDYKDWERWATQAINGDMDFKKQADSVLKKDRDKKTESQIRSAHQGDVSRSKKVKHSVIMNDTNYIEHHGILGQRWGVRRYQNPDGTLTSAGVKRYTKWSNKEGKRVLNRKGKKMYKATMKKELKEVKKKNKELLKRRSVLSDEELRKLTDRFAAEKRLSDAYAQTSKISRFKDQYIDELSRTGARTLANFTVNAAANAGAKAIEKSLNTNLKDLKLNDYMDLNKVRKATLDYKKAISEAKNDYDIEYNKAKSLNEQATRSFNTAEKNYNAYKDDYNRARNVVNALGGNTSENRQKMYTAEKNMYEAEKQMNNWRNSIDSATSSMAAAQSRYDKARAQADFRRGTDEINNYFEAQSAYDRDVRQRKEDNRNEARSYFR